MSIFVKCTYGLRLVAVSLVLTACSGGDGSPSVVDVDTESDITPRVGVVLRKQSAPELDRDRDGVPDLLDPLPDSAPLRPQDFDFLLSSVQARQGDGIWEGLRHAELPTEFSVVGLGAVGGPFYAVFTGPDAIAVHSLEPQDSQTLRLPPTPLENTFSAVYVVAGEWRTDAVALRTLREDAPLFARVDEAVAGSSLLVNGLNLADAQFWLGETELTAVSSGNQTATLALSATAVSAVLSATTDAGRYAQPLDVVRPVTVTRTSQTYMQGVLEWVAPGRLAAFSAQDQHFSIFTGTREPRSEIFVHGDNLGETVLRRVVIWPDETSKALNQQAILEDILFRHFVDVFGGVVASENKSWQQRRSLIQQLLQDPAAGQALSEIEAGQQDPAEFSLVAVFDALRPAASVLSASKKRFRTQGRDIYDVITTVRYADQVSSQREFQNYRVDIVDSDTCLIGTDLIGRGADFEPNDLCLENDSATFASIAVDVAERDHRTLDNGRSRLIWTRARDHISTAEPNLAFHPDVVGGTFGGVLQLASLAFLADNDGQPLCGGRRCRVELITGGFGLGLPPLSDPEERELAEEMWRRTMVEKTVLPVFDLLSGGLSGVFSQNCLSEQWLRVLFGNAGTVAGTVITVNDFKNKLGGQTDVGTIVGAFSDSILKTIVDTIIGDQLGSLLAECTPRPSDVTKVAEKAKDTLRQSAGKAVYALQVIQTLVDQAEIFATPQKFTIEVQPLAEVIQADDTIDLRFEPPQGQVNAFALSGDFIAADQPAEEAFYPIVALTDAVGNVATRSVQPNEFANVDNAFDFDGKTAAGQIIIELGNFEPSLAALTPPSLALSLRYPGYIEFPDATLVIPSGSLSFEKFPFVQGFDVDTEFAGNSRVLRGYKLDLAQDRQGNEALLAPNSIGVRLIDANGVVTEAENVEIIAIPGASEVFSAGIKFRIPPDLMPGEYVVSYRVGEQQDANDLSTPGQLTVLPEDALIVTLYDSGPKLDDAGRISLVRQNQAGLDVPVTTIGGEPAQAEFPFEGAYNAGFWVDPSEVETGNVDLIFECLNGSSDGVCTLVYEVERKGGSDGALFARKLRPGDPPQRIPLNDLLN